MKHLDPVGAPDASMAHLNRRHFLQLCASMLALATLSRTGGDNARAADWPRDNPFTLGVASGDPLPTGVVLWTRLAPKRSSQTAAWRRTKTFQFNGKSGLHQDYRCGFNPHRCFVMRFILALLTARVAISYRKMPSCWVDMR